MNRREFRKAGGKRAVASYVGAANGDGYEGDHTCPILLTRRADQVEAKAVEWLWPGWLPLGMLVLFDGDPGLGKSTLALDLAARVTRGWPMPGEHRARIGPADVVLLSAEDPVEQVLRPRLDSSGAALSRVHIIDAMRLGDTERQVSFPADLELLVALVRQHRAVLTIVDPLFGFLDLKTIDTNNDASARQVLHAMKTVAERTGSTFLCLRHLNKLQGGAAIYRGGGSVAFVGAARCAWVAGRHPDKAGTNVLAMNKSNVGPTPPSVEYEVRASNGTSCIGWGEACDLRPDDILAQPGRHTRGEKQADAVAFLSAELRAGPVPQKELESRARECGISLMTLRRAKDRLAVIARKEGLRGGWVWELPEGAHISADVSAFRKPGGMGAFEGGRPSKALTSPGPDDVSTLEDYRSCQICGWLLLPGWPPRGTRFNRAGLPVGPSGTIVEAGGGACSPQKSNWRPAKPPTRTERRHIRFGPESDGTGSGKMGTGGPRWPAVAPVGRGSAMPGGSKRRVDDHLAYLIACGCNYAQSAEVVGCSVRTAKRRLKEPGFRAQVREYQRELLAEASGKITSAASDAVQALEECMALGNDPRVRVVAARAILDRVGNVRALAAGEERRAGDKVPASAQPALPAGPAPLPALPAADPAATRLAFALGFMSALRLLGVHPDLGGG